MKDIKILALIICCTISIPIVLSQKVDTEKYNKGTLKKIGITADRSNDPYLAIDFYEKYLEKEKVDAKINYRLAENYRKARNYNKAIENYEVAYKMEPNKYALALYYLAQMQQALGNYEDAMKLYDDFSSEYRGKSDSYEYRRLAKFAMQGCQLALADSLNTNVVVSHLDGSVNNAHIESSPILLDKMLLFTSLPMGSLEAYPAHSDSFPRRRFYHAEEKELQWKNSGLWEEINFPQGKDISSGSVSPDGKKFYFSVCGTDGNNKTICEIWKSERSGDKWGKAESLGDVVNQSNYTSTQPAVGRDYKGREVLYFVSDRKGGKGGMDIWYSRYNDRSNEFGTPRNAGSKVNSIGDELSPFINPQNQNLYFSSNGHPGYGGLDIFRAVGERSKWLDPENIGKPFNSSVDELYYTLDNDGERGLFASNREKSMPLKNEHCCDDLFQFKHSDFVKINFKGQVVDEKGKSVENANMRLYILPRKKEREEGESADEIFIKELNTDSEGKYEFRLESGNNYVIKTKKDDYLLDEAPFSTISQKESIDVVHKVVLKELPYEAMVFRKIYHEYNQSGLTDTAKATIDNTILKIMLQNPEIVAEISSHTDSKGSDAYNKHLSQQRAEAVVNYLRSKGIDKSRMVAVGYGESKLLMEDTNEDGSDNLQKQAMNRRTEFKVIEKRKVVEQDDMDED